MGGLLKYSGIVTKIRAMQSHLLTDQNFEEIANLGTVTEAVTYLKSTPGYEDILRDADINTLHRGDVEKLLAQSLYNDYSRLYSFSGLEVRRFLKLYMKRYEVNLINYCSRIVFNHYQEPFDLNYKKPFFNQYSQLSIDRLMTARTMPELVEALHDTEYYKPLKKLAENGTPNLFDYDLALDLYYFNSIWKERKKVLKKQDLEMFTKSSGAKIDLLNLQWIYRAKKYYTLSAADIYSMLIPIQYHLNSGELKTLVEAGGLDEFMSAAQKTYYAKRYAFDSSHTIEQLYKDCLNHLYTAERRKFPYSLSAVNTYLFLKEEEIHKLTTTLECIRYGLTAKETLEYAGGVQKP